MRKFTRAQAESVRMKRLSGSGADFSRIFTIWLVSSTNRSEAVRTPLAKSPSARASLVDRIFASTARSASPYVLAPVGMRKYCVWSPRLHSAMFVWGWQFAAAFGEECEFPTNFYFPLQLWDLIRIRLYGDNSKINALTKRGGCGADLEWEIQIRFARIFAESHKFLPF